MLDDESCCNRVLAVGFPGLFWSLQQVMISESQRRLKGQKLRTGSLYKLFRFECCRCSVRLPSCLALSAISLQMGGPVAV